MENQINSGAPPAQTEQLLQENQKREALQRFLDTLTPEERTVFVLRYTAGMAVPEIAARCGKTRLAVRLSIARTERRLRRFLRKEGLL